MVPHVTVVAFAIATVVTLLLPVVLLLVLALRKKISGLPLLIGAGAFFVSQIVLRIPLLSVLSTLDWYQDFATLYLPYIFALSLSAGLFEESARWGGAVLLKQRRQYKDAVSFGLGHGLCEVILLIGLTYMNNLALCLLINSGNEAALSALSADVLANVKETLITLNPVDLYWGILERLSAVLFHIFATILIFKGIKEKKARFYGLAIAAHTVFNLCGVLTARYLGVAASEIALLAMALAAGGYTFKQKDHFDQPVAE